MFRVLDDYSVADFDDFLKMKNIAPDDARVPLLKEAWNLAVKSTSEYLGVLEGVSFGDVPALVVS